MFTMVSYTSFLAVLVLLAVPSFGVYEDYFKMDELRLRRGRPAGADNVPRYGTRECTRDLLIVWDNSNSVGKLPFTKYVKPFIKQIIDSEKLSVGPEGTQMGIISFSDHIKECLPFGSKTSRSDLKAIVNGLKYDDLKGGYTFTGRALKKANEIFSKKNPYNKRPEFPDVVILITDGNPRNGRWTPDDEPDTEIASAIEQADRLKGNDIRIVTVAVGQKKNMKIMKSLSTGEPFDVKNFEDLSGIVDSLVDESCKPLPGVCQCSETSSGTTYVMPGKKKSLRWPEPNLKCDNAPVIEKTEVNPAGTKPGHEFGVGTHEITYTMTYKAGMRLKSMTCPVYLNVKIYPCGGEDYDHNKQVCCCGVLHEKKPGSECCGSVYHDRSKTCCIPKYGFTVAAGRQCP